MLIGNTWDHLKLRTQKINDSNKVSTPRSHPLAGFVLSKIASRVFFRFLITGMVLGTVYGCSSSTSTSNNSDLYYDPRPPVKSKLKSSTTNNTKEKESSSYLYEKEAATEQNGKKEPISGIEFGAVTNNFNQNTGEDSNVRRKLDQQKEYLKELRKRNSE